VTGDDSVSSDSRAIGLVGLGEVGQIVAGELQRAERPLRCFDSRPGEITDPAATALAIPLAKDPAEFGASVDAVIVTVVGRASHAVALEVVPHLAPGTLYSDWTTTSPGVRDAIAEICAASGVLFADVSIVDTVTWVDRSIELLVSGPGAHLIGSVLDGTRLIPVVIDPERPVSTEVKLMRSVFTKGLEALLLETLSGAEELGIRADVERSVLRFMQEDFDRIIALLVGSSMKHAERRANEVRDVLEFVTGALGSAPMTGGAVSILEGLVRLNEASDGPPPEDGPAVLERVVGARMFGAIDTGVPAG
jgi:3-hydroxyisobutyrate dehydrogenase